MHTCVKDVRDEHHRDLLEGIYYGATTAMFILRVTDDGQFRYVGLNPAFMQVTGLSEEQVRDKTPEELVPLVPPEAARILISHCGRCLSEKRVVEYKECLSVRGHDTWWRTRLHPLRDKTGAIYRILGCSTDITRQKNAERELAEHRKQLQERTASEVRKLLRAVEESPVSVVITDNQGNIEYVNPKFCRLTGYEAKEVLGKNPRVLNAGIQDPALYKQMWQAISTGHEWKGEFCNRKKNGDLYWERASISPLQEPDGTITHYVAVKEDITEEKRMAQELERAKEMAQVASKAKSDFLASMSHELRTPLNSIIGFSEVLREQYFGALNSKQLEYVDDILASGRHLLDLINDILDIARIESGKQVLEREMVDIPEIVETGILMIREKASHHSIRIQTRFCTRCREQGVYADRRKLKQALFNLMANAVKFTPDGGTIDIEVDFVDPEAADTSLPGWLSPDMAASVTCPGLVISVSDTGVGIASEDLQHIFDPFYQTKEGVRVKTPSTGLGLTITREIMTMHGGHVWAMSDGPGKGSRFALHLPLVIQDETTGRDADEQECQCDEST